jgi:hypothetical protein
VVAANVLEGLKLIKDFAWVDLTKTNGCWKRKEKNITKQQQQNKTKKQWVSWNKGVEKIAKVNLPWRWTRFGRDFTICGKWPKSLVSRLTSRLRSLLKATGGLKTSGVSQGQSLRESTSKFAASGRSLSEDKVDI